MTNWTSIRAVYLMMSVVLTLGWIFDFWAIVVFVVLMLQVAVWTGFCPSKWLFEKLGYKKTKL
jgi:hypothetical protein